MTEPAANRADSWEVDLSSGALCLDFVNTLPDRPCCQKERLTDFLRLLTWAKQAGLLSTQEAKQLARRARNDPGEVSQELDEAIDFRECLYRIFSTLAAGGCVARDDLGLLNRRITMAYSQLRVKEGECGFEWAYPEGQGFLDSVLRPIARSAAELLTSADIELIRECGADTCSWLFIDRSRTKRRRWCDMKTCGNRAKAKRFYARHK